MEGGDGLCVSSMGVCVCVSFSYTPTLINFISLHLGSPTNGNIPQAYILLGGYPPFYSETNDNDELFEKICKAKYTFDPEWWDPVSPQAKDFIKKLLVVNQDKRLTATQAMRHEWFLAADHELAEKNLEKSLAQFKTWNAKRKFKGAVKAVSARKKLS